MSRHKHATSRRYRPVFRQGEYHNPTMHFRLPGTGGTPLIYAYIRKNACSTFKAYFNRRPHGKYLVRRWLLRDATATDGIGGNMAHYRHPLGSNDLEEDYMFVYRDPIERIWSLYKNKFLEESGQGQVVREFEAWAGKPAAETTFGDFMRYLDQPFALLNAHYAPQKSHLIEREYIAIRMDELGQTMVRLLGDSRGQHFRQTFNRTKSVVSSGPPSTTHRDRLEHLRTAHQRYGLRETDLMTENDRAFLRTKYQCDYAMIATIEQGHNQSGKEVTPGNRD